MTPGARPSVWTVSGLLVAVSDALASRLGSVMVKGELSGFTRAGSGHCYFTLKDAGGAAGLRCAMFRRAAQQLNFAPRDGLQVEVRGRLAVYEARGELQLVVESMQQQGAGQLYEEFLRLRARLAAEGLFEDAGKRVLPAYPAAVAVVTSAAGAALHDVLTTLKRRAPQIQVHLYPSLVQGPEAPLSLVAALARAEQDPVAELVILCRGGGSLEDLWAFNDERVVRALVACALPVVCGVGHETDLTLADLAADLRAPTPTAAAELVCPSQDELRSELAGMAQRMRRRVAQALDGQAQRLDNVSLRLQRPGQGLQAHRARLDTLRSRHAGVWRRSMDLARQRQQHLGGRWARAVSVLLDGQAQRLAAQAHRLHALDPRRVLRRGYAWMADPAGTPVVSAQGLRPGQELRAVWSDGEAKVVVDEVDPDSGA